MNNKKTMLSILGAVGLYCCAITSYAVIDGDLRLQNPRCKVNCTPLPLYPATAPQRGVQIAVVNPKVQIYVQPQPQYYYQQTEEVYLPYGGTYRKTTEYLPQYPVYPQKRPVNPQMILKKGSYYIEQ